MDVIDRLIDRLPALLLAGALALCAHVALFDRDEPRLLVAAAPGVLVLLLYLRAGSGPGRGARRGADG